MKLLIVIDMRISLKYSPSNREKYDTLCIRCRDRLK